MLVLLLEPFMFVALLLTFAFGVPSVGDLMIDLRARQTFVDTWSPAYVRVNYHRPLLPNEDPDRRMSYTTLGAIVKDAKTTYIVAPAHRLQGVDEVLIRFADGKSCRAKVEKATENKSVPLVRLLPKRSEALKGRVALKWAPRKRVVKGLKAWAVEWPAITPPPGNTLRPNLILSEIGKKVEFPLQRFVYVAMASADGMPLISHRGELLCVIFRQVPGTKRTSLCSPGDVAFSKAIVKLGP